MQGAPCTPSLGCGPCERGLGTHLCSEGSRPPLRAQEDVCGLGSQSPAWVYSASLLCSFPRKWKQPGFLNFLEEKPEDTIKPKSPRLGVPIGQQDMLLRAALRLQLLETSRETQQPVLASSGRSGRCPRFRLHCCMQPTPVSPDTARPHEPRSLNRRYNHSFRNTAGFKGLHGQNKC